MAGLHLQRKYKQVLEIAKLKRKLDLDVVNKEKLIFFKVKDNV
jgi:hypothetical protein